MSRVSVRSSYDRPYRPDSDRVNALSHYGVSHTSRSKYGTGQSKQISYAPSFAAEASSYTASSVASLYRMGPTNTRAKTYRVGQIVWTLHSIPNLDPRATLQDEAISVNGAGITTITKQRPFVVIGITETHMKCIPMYTSQGSGFTRMSPRKQWECIWLRQCQDSSDYWEGLTSRDFLMLTEETTSKGGSYLNWTRSVDVEYDWPIEKGGEITAASLNRLQEMHLISRNMSFICLEDQHKWAIKQLQTILVADEYSPMRKKWLGSTGVVTAVEGTTGDFSKMDIEPKVACPPRSNDLAPKSMTATGSTSGMSYSQAAKSKRPNENGKSERRSPPPQKYLDPGYRQQSAPRAYPTKGLNY